MSEVLIKTLTRHRDSSDEMFMRDWTAGDIVAIMPDGHYTGNAHGGWKSMGVVVCFNADIPQDFIAVREILGNKDKLLGRSELYIDLRDIMTDDQIHDAFDHDILVPPIRTDKSYLTLFRSRSERTELHQYDQHGSFDNQIVAVGPLTGHADANDWTEFESNVAISAGSVIGQCSEIYTDVGSVFINGCGAVLGKPIVFENIGVARFNGTVGAGALLGGGSSRKFLDYTGNVRFIGLEFTDNTITSLQTSTTTGECDVLLDNCCIVSNCGGTSVQTHASNFTFLNCLFRSNKSSQTFISNTKTKYLCINCTSTSRFVVQANADLKTVNCVFTSSETTGSHLIYTGYKWEMHNCSFYTDQPTLPTAGSTNNKFRQTYTDTFTNMSASNLSLKDDDILLRKRGNGNNPLIPVGLTKDVTGLTRPTQWSIGAYDLLNIVTVEINDVIIGSNVTVEKTSDGTVLYPPAIALTNKISFTHIHTKNIPITIKARKGTSGTKYIPWRGTALIDENGASIYVSQIPDDVANG